MKKLLLLFLALMPLAAAWANGGPARPISSLTYSRSPIHQHIPEVQIVDEHLDITPLGRYSLIEVRYTLRNQSDKDFRDIPYGFPVDYYGSGNCRSLEYRELYWGHGYHVQGWSDGYVREVSFALNGANLPYQCSADTLIRPRRSIADIQLSPAEKDTLLSAHEWYFGEMGDDDANFQEAAAHYRCGSIFEYESEIHRRWYYTHLAIAPHQEVVLTVRYRIFNLGFLFEEEQISIFTPVDVYSSVYYDFTPASYWGNGKADHIEINLHSHICNFDRPLYNDNLLQQKGETDWQYTADNFDLANATPLDIFFVGWHRNWYHYRKHRLAPDQYVLSLSCADSQYPIGNLSDTNAATAAVIHPDGKGRTHICIKLREPQELAGLVIVGGYAKSRDTWYNNGRIKELKMVVYDEHGTPLKKEFPWNQAHSAEQPMDTTHTQPLDLIYLTRNQQTIEIPLSIEDHIRLPEGNYTFPYSSELDHHKISEIHLQVTEQEPGLKSKLLCVSEIIVLGKGSH